ncbi:chemotaxis protein CheY [Asticcacaulis sp. AC460]|uniref:response regulator n=1 Tax=Asticcacaulis sp. AC460 TaxID=1282360 RepID=UPI0003C3D733|nr:response regulator [Asticcacaulis sp. AC460]ESQ92475.1 chemotaxis protein CheY [Asticcacaulis sp. AC460]
MSKRLIEDNRPAEILLVDDNRGDALLAQHALREASFATNLTVAQTGEIAMAILRGDGDHSGKRLPDLILLDLQLPQMSGLDVLTAIKAGERTKHIPVIVMSNSGAGRNVITSYRLHANAYVVKPLDITKYREAIALMEQFFFVLATLAEAES